MVTCSPQRSSWPCSILFKCTLSQPLEIYLILSTCSRCELFYLSRIAWLELFSSQIKSRRNFILLLLVCFHSVTGRLQHLSLSADRFGASVMPRTWKHATWMPQLMLWNQRKGNKSDLWSCSSNTEIKESIFRVKIIHMPSIVWQAKPEQSWWIPKKHMFLTFSAAYLEFMCSCSLLGV